jgi:hypothetical protein
MARESAEGLLLLKMELLCFQPGQSRHLFHAHLRIIAETNASIREIVSELLS